MVKKGPKKRKIDRFDMKGCKRSMKAVVTSGNGGYEKLEYRDFRSLENIWMGSDFDGAFAQFVKVGVEEILPVDCDWSDAELGTIPRA